MSENRETHLASLVLQNDRGSYEYWTEAMKEAILTASNDVEEAKRIVGLQMKNEFIECMEVSNLLPGTVLQSCYQMLLNKLTTKL